MTESRTEELDARGVGNVARQLAGRVDHGFLTATGARVRGDVHLRSASLDEMSLDTLAMTGRLTIERCHIGTLRLTDVTAKGGILIKSCDIGSIEVRSSTRSTVVIAGTTSSRLVVHGVDGISLDDVTFTGDAALSAIVSHAELSRVRADSVIIRGGGSLGMESIRVVDTRISSTFGVNDLDVVRVEISSLEAKHLKCRRVRSRALTLTDLDIIDSLQLLHMAGLGQDPMSADLSGHVGGLWIQALDGERCVVQLQSLMDRGDLSVNGDVDVRVGRGAYVHGVLRVDSGANSPTISVDESAQISRVAVPGFSVRRVADAHAVCRQLLGAARPGELAILHASLEGLPDQQDVAYFALRQAEAGSRNGWSRVGYWVRGHVFGWGVRFREPLFVLFGGLLLTSLVSFWLEPLSREEFPSRVLGSVTASVGLWTNAGAAMPAGNDGPAWAVASSICTLLGIVLVAVLTGVAIRRLTR